MLWGRKWTLTGLAISVSVIIAQWLVVYPCNVRMQGYVEQLDSVRETEDRWI